MGGGGDRRGAWHVCTENVTKKKEVEAGEEGGGREEEEPNKPCQRVSDTAIIKNSPGFEIETCGTPGRILDVPLSNRSQVFFPQILKHNCIFE